MGKDLITIKHSIQSHAAPSGSNPQPSKSPVQTDTAQTDKSYLLCKGREYRTLSQDFFHEFRAQAGGVSSPEYLLDYLHHTGEVFYREGLFGGQIVLDQAWALEAIYTVLHRENCYRELKRFGGRFTRNLLELLVWRDYSKDEQRLFLDMMQSCGVCFVLRKGDEKVGIEAEYIAPDREAVVEHFCQRATELGITVLRDRDTLKLGDRLSPFMQRIGRGDRVFVVISERYLQSPNCMFELFEIWRNCRAESDEFLQRVRIYTTPCARIFSVSDRLAHALHWKKEHDSLRALIQEHGADVLGAEDFKAYKRMDEFARHVGDILHTVADVIHARKFKDLEEYVFNG